MKKTASLLAAVLVFLGSFFLPAAALAAGESPPPPLPMEKVLGKNGNWYNEYINYDGQDNLIIGCLDKEVSLTGQTEVSIGEAAVLTALYMPLDEGMSEKTDLTLTDGKGNVYSGFTVAIADRLAIFEPVGHMVLPRGRYVVYLAGGQMLPGAVLLKGYSSTAFDSYEKKLLQWYGNNNPQQKELNIEMGSSGLADEEGKAGSPSEADKKPAKFELDDAYVIDEIKLNTYNKGKGAIPGYVTICDAGGAVVSSGKAYGAEFSGAQNGMWVYAPQVTLPAGMYTVKMTEPEALSYEADGTPMFYVKASVPVPVRYDFTGTYSINLDAYKVKTRQGNVDSSDSEFSLKDFQLTVLDCDGYVELIGEYQDMPFSQICEITEETQNRLTGKFDFAMDLSKLPYKARVGADAGVVLEYNGKEATISIKGNGFFKREAGGEYGADDNTYTIISRGVLKRKDLPPLVMTALGKPQNVGNIPGPDNASQAATGMLFPPLAGVVATVVQELLNKKPKAAVLRDKAWYKNHYPGKTDEEIAMIMLADAMGNTDNPDEGDAISRGDNEDWGTGRSQETEFAEPETEEDAWESGASEAEPEESAWGSEPAAGPESAPGPAAAPPLETRDITDPVTGNTTTYVKDPASGEWYDPETGYAFSEDAYKEARRSAGARDDYLNQARMDNAAADEHMQQAMQEIKQNEQHDRYVTELQKKYGTDDLAEIQRINNQQQKRDLENFKEWQEYADHLQTAENFTKVVGMGADVAIDLMGTAHPAIKNGYKMIKNMAGTAASDYAAGKGIGMGTLAEGAIKGVTDVGSDYIDVKAKYGVIKKAGALIIGETAADAAGAAFRGEDMVKAARGGLVDGTLNAVVGGVTDCATVRCPRLNLPEKGLTLGRVVKAITSTTHGGAQKMAGAAAKEFLIKPYTDQLKPQ